MNLEQLEAKLRSERLDDTVEPYLYSSARVRDALNDAVRQAAIRKRLLLDRSTEECCSYAVAAEDANVFLHPRVLAVRSARWSGTATPLTLTTLKRMDRDRPDWPSEPAKDPTHLIVDAQTGYVVLWPTPAAAGTLSLAVWRAPLESEELEEGDDEPVIDETFHIDLLDWAEHQCYLNKDGEAGDAQRAADAAARFTAKFGRLPTAHEIKCWALSPRRGQRAEFL